MRSKKLGYTELRKLKAALKVGQHRLTARKSKVPVYIVSMDHLMSYLITKKCNFVSMSTYTDYNFVSV